MLSIAKVLQTRTRMILWLSKIFLSITIARRADIGALISVIDFFVDSAAGLYGKVIEGFIKGVGYCPDHKFKLDTDAFRGSWNAVLIDGEWRLIDTHWGARHVTGTFFFSSQEAFTAVCSKLKAYFRE